MTPRVCRGCGEPEQRWVDGRGRPQVNLDPTTELCVTCLARRRGEARRRPAPTRRARFDARAAAARNDT